MPRVRHRRGRCHPFSKPSLEERSGFYWALKTNVIAIRIGDEKLAHVVKGIADVCWGAASDLNLSINLIKILASAITNRLVLALMIGVAVPIECRAHRGAKFRCGCLAPLVRREVV